MTTHPYSNIGPFKGVPEDARALAAFRANAASDRAMDASVRAASEVGDDVHREYSVHPSPRAATSVWDSGKANSARREARFLFAVTVGSCAVPAAFSVFSLCAYVFGWTGFMDSPPGREWVDAVGFGVMACFVLAVTWMPGRRAAADLREIRQQGFVGDTLPRPVMRVAGVQWLFGSAAVHIGQADDDLYSESRSIYYDAIGKTTIVEKKGIRYVVLIGRDGLELARIADPRGGAFQSPEAVAAKITGLAAAARKAA
ncbi:hypothetical protein OIU34_24405 [Pararhizobium sp. BT-229]|uniref:hypothetical protein n=1 Tax=Pararhizobium sp. BT-229 TaxID=2986923 RepID=UPI0021F6B0B0|nr:hypothetical protein [Pararhizobium sp. BT-229]MCV9965043.1 hypothetical protein [Pararhizobium sp. BT-229]